MRFLAALICACLALTQAPAAAEEVLRIGRNAGPGAYMADGTELVLRAAYAKLGIALKFEEYPLLRSLIMADAGAIDGDNMRIAETSAQYPNLVRVEVPVNYLEITAYARSPCPVLKGFDDLKGQRVAYIRGVLAIPRRLREAKAVPVDNMGDLFRVLERGMVDVALGTGLETDHELMRRPETNLCKVNGVLETVPLYHHLNKRHAALAARVTEQLQAMQRRGEIEAILRRDRERAMKQ